MFLSLLALCSISLRGNVRCLLMSQLLSWLGIELFKIPGWFVDPEFQILCAAMLDVRRISWIMSCFPLNSISANSFLLVLLGGRGFAHGSSTHLPTQRLFTFLPFSFSCLWEKGGIYKLFGDHEYEWACLCVSFICCCKHPEIWDDTNFYSRSKILARAWPVHLTGLGF